MFKLKIKKNIVLKNLKRNLKKAIKEKKKPSSIKISNFYSISFNNFGFVVIKNTFFYLNSFLTLK